MIVIALLVIHDENPAVQFSWFKKYFVEKLSQQSLI